jgi:hypothetical protein
MRIAGIPTRLMSQVNIEVVDRMEGKAVEVGGACAEKTVRTEPIMNQRPGPSIIDVSMEDGLAGLPDPNGGDIIWEEIFQLSVSCKGGYAGFCGEPTACWVHKQPYKHTRTPTKILGSNDHAGYEKLAEAGMVRRVNWYRQGCRRAK